MLHPAYINLNYFFYPTGNTPATCLTQDLPQEQSANILLLGCGDPRNILFTLYNSDPDGKSTSPPGRSLPFQALGLHLSNCLPLRAGSRVLDFTCCDIEPALLGRVCPSSLHFCDCCKLNCSLAPWQLEMYSSLRYCLTTCTRQKTSTIRHCYGTSSTTSSSTTTLWTY